MSGGLAALAGRRRLPSVARPLVEPPGFLPPLVVQSIKVAVASALAWWIGPFLGLPHPFNAVLAVIILMQGHAYGSLLNALQFLLGVAAGLLLGIGANLLVGISSLTLAAIMFACLLIGGRLRVSSQGFNNQIAVSALLVLASGSADNVDRLWETVLGGAVGVLVAAFLWPPNPVRQLRQEYRGLRVLLGQDVLRSLELAGHREGGVDPEANRRRVREHSERADGAVAAIGSAEEALRWNPWHSTRIHDLSFLEDRLRLVSYLYRTVRALARQAAEAPLFDSEQRGEWDSVRPHLLAAGSGVVEAIDRRLAGRDPSEAGRRGREDVDRFAAGAPREPHAAALAAALDDLLNDVEGWRPDNRVDPERQLVSRILRRLGRQPGRSLAHEAGLEFEEELRRGRLREFTGAMTGEQRTPPLLGDVVKAAGETEKTEAGVQEIPLSQIKGFESRTPDFDVSFLPRTRRVRQRWVQLYEQMEQGLPVEPIEVYRVGDVYFVKHGHNRVSVARRLGRARIPANVVEVATRAPVGAVLTDQELLHAAEYAGFLERTQLDRVRPEARIACSELGRYDVIYDHIQGHRYFMSVERGREVSIPEAAAGWYDSVYRPLMDLVHAHEMSSRLAGWTEADIYLALTRVWLELDEEGRPSGPEGAVQALLSDPAGGRRKPGSRRHRLGRRIRRLLSRRP